MATVFRARDEVGGGPVAVKLLRDDASLGRDRFEREAALLDEVSHPAIVGYLAHGRTPDGEAWLVMEWLEGEDLAQRLARGPLTASETVALGRRVAAGLAAAHARDIVHRDVKPSNIYLPGGDAACARLIDFGVARALRTASRLTRTGLVIGTVRYMAPEQARGRRDVDARSDSFALGCVLFECLTGRCAFDGDHELSVLASVLFDEPPSITGLRPDVPPALARFVERLITKDPAKRPRDGAEIVTWLDQACDGGAVTSEAARPALTTREKRLVHVIVALTHGAEADSDGTAPTAAHGEVADERRVLRDAVRPFGASVELLLDGAVVAVISGSGLPTDQAARAARAALAIGRRLPGVPIALQTGKWVTGRVPVADVVDHVLGGGRLRRGAGIALDELTAGLLDRHFEVEATGAGPYLVREVPVAGPQWTVLGRPTPFVGRRTELAVLEATLVSCAEEQAARLVLITGAAGSGKSRLIAELTHRMSGSPELVEERVEVLFGEGDPHGSDSAFGLLAPIVRRAAGLPRVELGEATVADEGKAPTEPLSSLLAALLGIGPDTVLDRPDDDTARIKLRSALADARVMAQALREAWLEWLAARCAARPVVLILEDLHFADHMSLRFVAAALTALRDSPLLVVGVSRPEARETLNRRFTEEGSFGGSLVDLRLGALSRRDAGRLVRAMLGDDASDERVSALVDRAEGNPFYLEELIRAQAGGGDIPETVLGMVQARLDAQEPELRQVLRAGSVFGHVFWDGGVRALVADPAPLPAALSALLHAEVLKGVPQSRFAGEREYGFCHTLMREAAYASLTERDRRVGHHLGAAWLEAAGDLDAARLARHYELGEAPREAAAWYARAAAHALESGDPDSAIRFAERTRTLAPAASEAGAILLVEAEAHSLRDENTIALERATQAAGALAEGTTGWYRAVSLLVLSAVRHTPPRDVGGWLEALARGPDGDPGARLIALWWVCALCWWARWPDQAERLDARARGLSQNRLQTPLVEARRHWARAFRAFRNDDVQGQLDHYASALVHFELAGDDRTAVVARNNLGHVLALLGDGAAAAAHLRGALQRAERLGLPEQGAYARYALSLALIRDGALEEANALAAQAVEFYARSGRRLMEGEARRYRSEALACLGRLAEAEGEARGALACVGDTPRKRFATLAQLARVQLAQGRPRQALDTADEAEALATFADAVDRGAVLLQLVRGEALQALDRAADAGPVLVAGLRAVEQRAAGLRDPELRARFATGIWEHARLRALSGGRAG